MFQTVKKNTTTGKGEIKNNGGPFFSPFIQPKLSINQPGDIYEREADVVADRVMRTPDFEARPFFSPGLLLQRKCKHCEEEEKVHRKEMDDRETNVDVELENYVGNLNHTGQPLSNEIRGFFESRIGYDFSEVKVHRDSVAAKSAQSINALAYTSGNHIVFNNAQYSPDTVNGKKLLAHELTHVVQQSGNILPKIQREPDDDKKEPKSEIGKAIKNNGLFKKLPKFAQDKILDEIDKAPETITKAVLDKIIDLAPIDQQYKDGLKKAGEAIIQTITGSKPPSTSICDGIPGYHEGTSSDYKGQCCTGTFESAQACCPKDRFAPKDGVGKCCNPGEVVDSLGKCMKPAPVDVKDICVAPGKKDALGKCCMPPMDVIGGMCVNPPKPEPKPQPFALKFKIGVIDDYNIDEAVINSRQKAHFDEVKKQIHQFMENCPSSMIDITGYTDKPGTEEHNMDLGKRRADNVKFLLQLDLIKINVAGLPPLIFSHSEGENNPADAEAGEKFSAANRRVEIELNSMCPPLGSSTLTKPSFTLPLNKTNEIYGNY